MEETQPVGEAGASEPPPPAVFDASEPSPDRFPSEIGDYRLLEHLGQGGMGVVFLALQKSLDRQVALKLLKPGQASCPKARQVLFREARAASKLEHPGICPIYEIGEAQGIPFLAMRYIEGQTLADRIRSARTAAPPTESGRHPLPTGPDRKEALELIRLVEEAARAVHAAHEAGLIHRDIKPSNLMISAGLKPVILDFGLAREERLEPSQATLTQAPLGTPTYMPPEQLEENAPAPDRRTDVYALGVTLHEALTLRAPFESPTWALLYQKIRTGDHPDPLKLNPRLPADIKTVLAVAMEHDPARRYQSAEAFAEDLRRVRLRLPLAVRPAGPLLRLGRWTQRNPVLASSLFATLLLLAAGLAISLVMLDMVQRSLARTRALGLASLSAQLLEEDPIQALQLAREAASHAPLPSVLAQLLACLQETRERARFETDGSLVPATFELSTSGKLVAVASSKGTAHVLDLTGRTLLTLDALEPEEPEGSALFIALAFSPNETRLLALARFDIASGSRDARTRIALWDLEGKQRLALEETGPAAARAAFTMDGKGLVLIERLGTVRQLTLDGQETGRFPTLDGAVGVWRFDGSNGLLLAKRNRPEALFSEIGAWDTSGRVLFHEPALEGRFNLLRVFPAGPRFGLASARHALVLDRCGTRIHDLRITTSQQISAIATSPDGGLLALGFQDGQISLHAAGGEETARWAAHSDVVRDLAFAPDGESLLSASKDRRASLWSPHGKELFTLNGHEAEVNMARFTPDGGTILTHGVDRTLRIWDVTIPGMPFLATSTQTWAPIACRPGRADVLCIAPCGNLASWDMHGVKRMLTHSMEPPARSLWASPTDGAILTAHKVGTRHVGRIWDFEGHPLGLLDGHSGFILTAEFSTQGERILTLSSDGTIRLWDRGGNELLRIEVAEGAVQSIGLMSLSATGEQVLAASRDPTAGRTATLWNLRGEAIAHFPHDQRISALSIAPCGLLASTGDEVGIIRLWDQRGALLHQFEGTGEPVSSLGFHPDSTHLLATSSDRSARLWDARSGKLLLRFEETESELRHGEFSPDGSSFLTASPRTVRIWDLRRLEQLIEIRTWKHDLRATTRRFARFCPSGKRVLTVQADGMVRTWPATQEAALSLAEARAHRPLSAAQRERSRELLRAAR